MHPRIARWIWVSGAPRSGTTFVGKVLSSALDVDYIHEPFNPDCGIAGVEHPYLYLEDGEPRELALRPQIERLLDYRADLRTGFYPNDTALRRLAKHVVGSRGPFYLRLARMNPMHRAAVVKDPVGCLMTAYMLRRYGMRPIVIVRNPLGFVASVKRLRWEPSLAPLLGQPRLAQSLLEPADLRIARKFAQGTALQRAAVLWRLLNRALLGMAAAHPGILVVSHEELSEQPLETFERLFAHAGLPFAAGARRRVLRLTSGASAQARGGRVQDFRRDSRRIGEQQRATLSARDVSQVRAITDPVASLFYPPEALRA